MNTKPNQIALTILHINAKCLSLIQVYILLECIQFIGCVHPNKNKHDSNNSYQTDNTRTKNVDIHRVMQHPTKKKQKQTHTKKRAHTFLWL